MEFKTLEESKELWKQWIDEVEKVDVVRCRILEEKNRVTKEYEDAGYEVQDLGCGILFMKKVK